MDKMDMIIVKEGSLFKYGECRNIYRIKSHLFFTQISFLYLVAFFIYVCSDLLKSLNKIIPMP